jgi:hypothetical protein|nr:MAG TPA: hypothetical protein [Caudoviricetes sp.]
MPDPVVTNEKIERKYLAHFIDASFGGTTVNYVRLGKDLEEYAIEMNPDSETKKNILGENSTNVKGYEPQGSVDPYYAYRGDPLYEHLADIINNRSTGSALETTVVDVLLKADGSCEWAYRENAIVIPQSIGGEDGVQIPFEIHYNGNREKGTFDLTTKAFTKDTV